ECEQFEEFTYQSQSMNKVLKSPYICAHFVNDRIQSTDSKYDKILPTISLNLSILSKHTVELISLPHTVSVCHSQDSLRDRVHKMQ
ncbi:hypothetical protein L9F63_026691, partial [Diploptera punctata]